MPDKPRWPLWRAFWLVAVPIAVTYQLIWAGTFSLLAAHSWDFKQYQTVVAVKLLSEIALYCGLSLFLIRRSTHQKHWLQWLASGVFILLAAMTIPSLLEYAGS